MSDDRRKRPWQTRADEKADLTPGARVREALPPALPAGELPPESSNMWFTSIKALQQAEQFIQGDTRTWFAVHAECVPVCRSYPDHPRWHMDGRLARAAYNNLAIVAEVHMLVRIANGLDPFPPRAYARMEIKSTQAQLAYKLTHGLEKSWNKFGQQALDDLFQRAPAAALKLLQAVAIPKRVEHKVDHTVKDERVLDPDTANALMDAISAELKRRTAQARHEMLEPNDVQIIDAVAQAHEVGLDLHFASRHVVPGSSVRGIGVDSAESSVQNYPVIRNISDPSKPDFDPELFKEEDW